MAGDIFLTDRRAWSAGSLFFDKVIQRAISKCREADHQELKALHDADQIRCLGINLENDRGLQRSLTVRVIEAAEEFFRELRGNPAAHPGDIISLDVLIATAKAYLQELDGPAPH